MANALGLCPCCIWFALCLVLEHGLRWVRLSETIQRIRRTSGPRSVAGGDGRTHGWVSSAAIRYAPDRGILSRTAFGAMRAYGVRDVSAGPAAGSKT